MAKIALKGIPEGSATITVQPPNSVTNRTITLPDSDGELLNDTNLAAPGGSNLVGFLQDGTGAVARTMQDKGREIKSISDFSSVESALSSAKSGGFRLDVGEDIIIDVPSHVATMQDAIDYISPRLGVSVTINIESGHTLDSGIEVRDGDFSSFKITSDDATVYLDSAWADGAPLLKGYNAKMPTWGIFVDCESYDIGDSSYPDADGGMGAIRVLFGSSLNILPSCGACNGGSNGIGLFVYRGSKVIGPQSVFTGFTQNNIWITHESDAYIERIVATGAGVNGAFVSRASRVYAVGGDFSGAGEYGALVYRSRFVAFPYGADTASKFNSCGLAGIRAEQGSVVNVPFRNVAPQFHDETTHGIEAISGSIVDATGASFDTIVADAVRCSTGANVICMNATFVDVARDVLSCGTTGGGGNIDASGITADSAGRYAIYCNLGGRVIASQSSIKSSTNNAIFCSSGGYVCAPQCNASDCLSNAFYANGGEIDASSSTATGAGGRGGIARLGGRLNVTGANLSGAAVGGLRAETGGRIEAANCNAQAGASPAASDVQAVTGSIITFNGGTGGTSLTVNTISSSGIIFA